MSHLIKNYIAYKRHLKFMKDEIQVQMYKSVYKEVSSSKQVPIEFRI